MKNFSGPIEARFQIRELFGAYSDSVFQKDVEAWLSHWTDSGVWLLIRQEVRGKAELRAQWEKLWQSLNNMMFFTEIGSITVEGDRARCRSYCREILHLKNGSIQKVVGMYEDELISVNGEWYFERRNYQLISDEKKYK